MNNTRGSEVDADEPQDDDETLSFEDLGAAFAKAAAEVDRDTVSGEGAATGLASTGPDVDSEPAVADEEDDVDAGTPDSMVTPEAIIEGALFVGHPENLSFTEQRLASLMRDVTPEEVVQLIDQLNVSYREAGQALRIVQDDQGYRLSTAPELDSLRQQFLGKVRETRLSQLAVEVLALVAYQPGVTAQTVRDQRGRDCGSILNQLVRRRLLEIKREPGEPGGRPVQTYYPTERFLALFHLESLDDLPQVDSFDPGTE